MGLGVIQEGCLIERSGYLQIRSIVIKFFSLTQNKRLKKLQICKSYRSVGYR